VLPLSVGGGVVGKLFVYLSLCTLGLAWAGSHSLLGVTPPPPPPPLPIPRRWDIPARPEVTLRLLWIGGSGSSPNRLY